MFSKKVYHPNSVDVLRNDGTAQRGLVLDKQESGVLVDFGIGGMDPELIPYRHVFLDDKLTAFQKKKPCDTDQMQVLLKRDYDQPWTWYPCRFLEGSLRTFAVVEARIGEDRVVEFVCAERVRCHPSIRRRLQRTEEPTEEEICLGEIPLDVMEMVFSFLDARTQVILRPVCRVWDAAALSPECWEIAVLDVGVIFRQGVNFEYLLAGLLYHCVKKSTKSLIILNGKRQRLAPRVTSFVREKMLENRCVSVCILALANAEAESVILTVDLVNKMSFFGTVERLEDTVNMLFEQMLESPDYSDLFSRLCVSFYTIEAKNEQGKSVKFRTLLVSRLQKQFFLMLSEKDEAEPGGNDNSSAAVKGKRATIKPRDLSITRFLAWLYKLGGLTERIILCSLIQLLPGADAGKECNLVYLCEMLHRCAPKIKQQAVVDDIFHRLQKFINTDGISTPVRHMMQKTVDFINRNYVDL